MPSQPRPVVLVNPPQARPCEPPPGLLVLGQHLVENGVEVRLFDANLSTLELLLAPDSLSGAALHLEQRGAPSAMRTSAHRCARRGPAVVASLRGGGAYADHRTYRGATDIVAECLRSVSRARGVRLSLSDLEVPGLSPLAGKDVLKTFRDPSIVGIGPELSAAADRVMATDPGLVGISATYLSQVLPAAAFTGLLRHKGFRGRVVLGGGVVTSWLARLLPNSDVFSVWDILVAGPGETAMLTLAMGSDPGPAPGVLAPARGIWNPTGNGQSSEVSSRPFLGGNPWQRYLAPGPILPLATCRGCYWRRCTYCPEAAQDRQLFRPASHRQLVDDVLRARDEYGVSHVHFTDDAIPPGTLRRLARGLRGQGVKWYGFVRPEPGLANPALAEELSLGGCDMLQLGIESASQGVLDQLGKGCRAIDASPILANLAGAEIRTYVYLLYGVPGESDAERTATTEWAAEHSGHISFLNLALMNVPRQVSEDIAGPGGQEFSLYAGLEPGDPFQRGAARRSLTAARSHPALKPILRRTPPGFGANHAAWVPVGE